jgi:hypothetical protein
MTSGGNIIVWETPAGVAGGPIQYEDLHEEDE